MIAIDRTRVAAPQIAPHFASFLLLAVIPRAVKYVLPLRKLRDRYKTEPVSYTHLDVYKRQKLTLEYTTRPSVTSGSSPASFLTPQETERRPMEIRCV